MQDNFKKFSAHWSITKSPYSLQASELLPDCTACGRVMDSSIIFLVFAYALRGYGVTLGTSSRMAQFFSRPPARRAYGSESSGVRGEHDRLGRAGGRRDGSDTAWWRSGAALGQAGGRPSKGLRAAARVVTESFFWGGSAYALRGYGVTLGSSSSHDPFFSRAAA